ncbi:hypothetical protein, partial [Pseudomonas poae]|uniref:hypothetical protein n=1 Tax=Pseudomonas poae TaxID=200451 RepID=UPI001F165ED1
ADGWGIVEKTADYCRGRQVSDLKLTRVGFFGGVAYISVIWVTATGSKCPHAGVVDGAPEIKIKSQSKAGQKHDLSPIRFSVGAGLPAMQTPQSIRKTQSMPSQASQLPHLQRTADNPGRL